MKTESSVEIDRPLEQVFDYTTQNTAEWSAIVVSDEVLEETPDSVGSTVNAKGFMKLMFCLMGWAMKKSSCDVLDKELASLKQKQEASAADAAK